MPLSVRQPDHAVVRSCYAHGNSSNRAVSPRGGAASGDLQQRLQPIRSQLADYEALCRETGAKPAHVALAWLLRDPVVSTAVVGARSVEQVHANLAGLALHLEPDVLLRLDHIWPGPGEAPQAYAW
jgi:aryl-alcohol dehydrogenase-like predicted oxidoreductase